MRKITERQTQLILKALAFYHRRLIEIQDIVKEFSEASLPELNHTIKRIDRLFSQLLHGEAKLLKPPREKE